MKVSLNGLLQNIISALPPLERKYYACFLEELQEHIVGLVNGKYSPEEFSEHYRIERALSPTEGE